MFKNYLKIAWKVFLRRKFFTFISLFGISFTLIVLMVVAAIYDHTFAPMPPETDMDRTLCVFRTSLTGPNVGIHSFAGYGFLDRYLRDMPGVEAYSISTDTARDVTSFLKGEKLKLALRRTDGEFWKVFDYHFLEGGPFTPRDDENRNFVAVINETTRRKFFGEGPAVGEKIQLDGQNFRIVGVVSDVPLFRLLSFADVWVPISTIPSDSYRTELVGYFIGILKAKSRADFPIIREEFQSRLSRVEFPDPRFDKLEAEAQTLMELVSSMFTGYQGGGEGRFIASLLLLMVLFMILPALNLVNINMSRIMERSSEIGVRKAFGASSRSLIIQFVTENVLLTLVGGLIGFIGSLFVLQVISASDLIKYAEFHMNYRIFLYGLALTLFFGVFSGVYPAWRMSRLHPVQALRGGVQ